MSKFVYRGEAGPFEPGVAYDLARDPVGDDWEPAAPDGPVPASKTKAAPAATDEEQS